VGLILDLAVVALAVAVIGSLALLAWTLSVSAVRATNERRREVADARRRVASLEDRMRVARERAAATLTRVGERIEQ
jgi:hypothetical protein